jgi:hypothetical protein
MISTVWDIIPIQASSVPSERVFSSGKETLTAHRTRISPELMESLQMLKFGLKKQLNFTELMDWNEELKALEVAMENEIPDDIASYREIHLAQLEQLEQLEHEESS